jgi:hypothetical protein
MSPLLDDVDERIRSTLLQMPVGDDGTADVLPAVRAGARSRRNRRRVVAVTGAVVALGLAGFSIAGGTDDQPVRTASAPETPTRATTREYPPLTPLADGPLPAVPKTTLIEHDGYVHSIESLPGRVIVRDEGFGSSASLEFDPETTSAIELVTGGGSSDDPDRKRNVLGVTRADVARVEWVVPSGTLDAETFGLPAFPQLRFFFMENPEQLMLDEEMRLELPHIIAYGADGAVLADSKKIREYEADHVDEIEAREIEVDRRRGVEVKDAGIADARVEHEALTVEIYRCEGDPTVAWTEDDDAIRVSATVKRPMAEGACLTGETKVMSIGFSEPVGDRPILDALTGEVLLEAGSGL